MRYYELREGRDAPLYHWMDAAKAKNVLRRDVLSPLFTHKIVGKPGISMTRNKAYSHHNGSQLCLVFDQRKLTQTNKIVPLDSERAMAVDNGFVDDSHHDRRRSWGIPGLETAEEYVIGPIQPLHRYLNEIWIAEHNDMDYIRSVLVYAIHYGIPVKVLDDPYFWDAYRELAPKWYRQWRQRKIRTAA